MHGLEYLTSAVLKKLWAELAEFVQEQATTTDGGLAALLRAIDPSHHLLGRVTFHLAENKKDDVENLEVEVLKDSDLESVAGGASDNNILSNVKNACCPTSDPTPPVGTSPILIA